MLSLVGGNHERERNRAAQLILFTSVAARIGKLEVRFGFQEYHQARSNAGPPIRRVQRHCSFGGTEACFVETVDRGRWPGPVGSSSSSGARSGVDAA